jgi:hypothetical protein
MGKRVQGSGRCLRIAALDDKEMEAKVGGMIDKTFSESGLACDLLTESVIGMWRTHGWSGGERRGRGSLER